MWEAEGGSLRPCSCSARSREFPQAKMANHDATSAKSTIRTIPRDLRIALNSQMLQTPRFRPRTQRMYLIFNGLSIKIGIFRDFLVGQPLSNQPRYAGFKE